MYESIKIPGMKELINYYIKRDEDTERINTFEMSYFRNIERMKAQRTINECILEQEKGYKMNEDRILEEEARLLN